MCSSRGFHVPVIITGCEEENNVNSVKFKIKRTLNLYWKPINIVAMTMVQEEFT